MTQVADQLANEIIKEQALIIGPVAWDEAKKVQGLSLDINLHQVNIEGDVKTVLGALVARYERLFGQASREVCRDAVKPFIAKLPQDQLPATLR